MDKYDELKYNPQFLKKAYNLVKEDFSKLFRDDNNYTEEDKKNWDIALDRIYDNFVTPEEQDFIEIWGDTDGTIGLIDYVHENENQFMESSNKYVKAFRESCKKLEEAPTAEYEYDPYSEPYESGTEDYEIDMDIVNGITSIIKQLNIIARDDKLWTYGSGNWKNHFNRDAVKIAQQCSDLLSELLNSYDLSSPELKNIHYVGRRKDEPVRWNRKAYNRLDSKFLRSNKILPYSTRDKKHII